MEVTRARRSLAGALDIYKEEVMVHKRTVVGRFQGSQHNKHGRGHDRAHTQGRGFVRSFYGLDRGRSSGVNCVDKNPRGHADAGPAACGVLTSGRGGALDVVKDGAHRQRPGQVRDRRTSCSSQGTSNHRLQATVGVLGGAGPARRAFAHRA